MVQLLMNCESVVMISAAMAIEVSAAHSSNELASKFSSVSLHAYVIII